MNKKLARILCCIIPIKSVRTRVRNWLFSSSKGTLSWEITMLNEEISTLRYFLNKSVDITKIPKAKNQLRTIQKDGIDLLKYLDKVCKEHNIKYWLDFGTLLGSVRHKGFIPWDDDIDVGMLREDYSKLVKLGKELKNSDSYFKLCSNMEHYSVFHLENKNVKAWLDIFPYDSYYMDIVEEKDKDIFYKNYSEAQKGLKRNLFQIINRSDEEFLKELDNFINKEILKNQIPCIDIKPSLFLGIEFPHTCIGKMISYNTIFPLRELEFENFKFPVPNNYNEHLTNLYGDYMSFPKRVHNHFGLK